MTRRAYSDLFDSVQSLRVKACREASVRQRTDAAVPSPYKTAMDATRPLHLALSRWENEGGTVPGQRRANSSANGRPFSAPASDAVELAQLRIRVIALENLVITLLAELSEQQLGLAREMAAYISPRPGFTHHRPTTHAAAQMIHLVERAGHFRGAAANGGA
jgi:hypothetical protein